ncbi:hypothetical protein [Caulobacter sp. 17J80-11]|uniref:hypothetical protein n=1 Tax=Caulobacter sp. 17J80-11 TaxID=2763502 RepID=UPI00165384AA|nr:hypothetical protein [Caulobacter sp. 17J80-11]MBC6983586.1 hypothetical protein [Caulobacter sp. 17J80-11]
MDRLVAVDAAAAIERLQGSPLAAEGRVHLLGLDAVRERLGERWPGKREQIWDNVERCLTRKLGVVGWFLRVGEADFLVVQPAATRFEAQALCLNALKEVLNFFLGQARAADLALREVTEVSAAGLAYRRLDPSEIADAAMEVATAEAPLPPLRRVEPAAWSVMATQDGRSLSVSCAIQPLFELSRLTLIGHRLQPRVLNAATGAVLTPAQIDALDWADRERVDLAVLERGLARLKSDPRREQKPGVVVPLAFTTLASTRGRAALAQAFCDARDDLALKTLVSVQGLKGVPTGRLWEAVSLIQPFCFAVTGAAEPDRAAVQRLTGCGLKGLTFECDPGGHEDENALFAWLRRVARMAEPVAPRRLVAGLTSPRQLAIARLAGFTHASLGGPRTTRRPT